MRVHVNDKRLLRDLILFLRECGCVAEQASEDEADVDVPAAPNGRAARTEVGVYLATWHIRHEGAAAETSPRASTLAESRERRGTVKELDGEQAILAMEDGSEIAITAPEVTYAS